MSSKTFARVRDRRRWWSGILCAILVFVLAGCSYFFKESPKPDNSFRFQAVEGQRTCLARSLEIVMGVLEGATDSEDTERVITCAVGAIDTFLLRTRPEAANGRYSRESLQSFIEAYLMNERKMDAHLMPLLFRWKASWLGGSEQEISREELLRIRRLLESFRDIAADLRPHADIYMRRASLQSTVVEDHVRFAQAADALERAARRISEQLQDSQIGARPDFSVADIERLLAEGEKTADALPYMKLLSLVKQVLVRPPQDLVQASDWPVVISTTARLYSLYLRHHYFLNSASFIFDSDPGQLEIFVHETLDMFEAGLERRREQVDGSGKLFGSLEEAEIDALIEQLVELNFWPDRIRPSAVRAFLWPLSARLLRDEAKPPPARPKHSGERQPVRFGQDEVRRLRMILEDWIAGHRLSHAAAPDAVRVYPAQELTASFSVQDVVLPFTSALAPDVVRSARIAMTTLLKRGRVLAHDEAKRLLIVGRTMSQGMKRRDLVFLNLIRSMLGAVLRGYSEDPTRSRALSGITDLEVQEFYLDVRELGIDLEFLDSRVYNAGARSFTEANLFTSTGDGNHLMTLHEGIEFFESVFAGGLVAITLQKDLEANGCGTGLTDYTGVMRLRAECVRRYLRGNFKRYFANLPGMTRFVQQIQHDEEAWKELVFTFEEAARSAGSTSAPYEFSDVKTLVPVLYYAESLFVDYDRDRNGILNNQEVWSAFPKFRRFIRDLGQGQANSLDVQKTVFSYMITWGRPPSAGWFGKLGVGIWAGLSEFYEESATRLDVLKVIASISVQAREVRFTELETYFDKAFERLPRAMSSGHAATVERLTTLLACPQSATGRMREMMRVHAKEWMARAPYEDWTEVSCGDSYPDCPRVEQRLSARRFARRADATIQADPELRKVCWPLF